ncbi:hypothetical protein J4209_02640 [Candidatus Woesearchaeota archaeon]|nr:hypothetical protein [Candidatus Woesearchaeota archaeon]
MNKKMKLFSVLMLFVIGILAAGFASAAQISAIQEVKISGDVIDETGTNYILGLERGEEFDVKVKVSSAFALDDAQVEAMVRGYDHDDLIDDISDTFDMKAGVTYYKTLNLKLPSRMDQDTYQLRVMVSDRNNTQEVKDYTLEIDTARHKLEIKDIVLNPENEVQAGRSLLTTVRLKNRGESQEEDIKVKVSIPALGISASDYIDELDEEDCADSGCDDSTTSEEIYMRIPVDAATGDYTVKVEVGYDDGDEKETETATIRIIGEEETAATSDTTTAKTIITVGPEIQDITKGAGGVVYLLTISNTASTSKTYAVSTGGADWADFSITPSKVVVVDAGESSTVYISVSAKDTATAGENSFTLSIKSGEKTLKEVALKANVVEPKTSGWKTLKRALEVGLFVLIVLLVILGLIIGFTKLKGSEEEPKEEEKTYY